MLHLSLENIYAELAADIRDFKHPGHGELTGWAKQGVQNLLPWPKEVMFLQTFVCLLVCFVSLFV